MIYGRITNTENDEGFTRIPDKKRQGTPPPYKPGDELKPLSPEETAALAETLAPDMILELFGPVELTAESLPELADMAFAQIMPGYDVNTDVIIGKLQRLTVEQRQALLDTFPTLR